MGTTTTRFTEAIGGDLSATIASDGGLVISLGNPHGDVVTTVDIPADQAATTPATAISGWATYDEYGNTTTADPWTAPSATAGSEPSNAPPAQPPPDSR